MILGHTGRNQKICTVPARGLVLALSVVLVMASMAQKPASATSGKVVLEKRHAGIEFLAIAPSKDVKYDIPLWKSKRGLGAVIKAVDILLSKSPYSAAKIETLRRNGRVVVVYDPSFPAKQVASMTVAAFFPGFFEKDGDSKDFVVVVGRYGVKWPAKELAAVLAHELVGHGIQHLSGRLSLMRELDQECEAWLYEEIVFQDVGAEKHTQDMVDFRRVLEKHYCSDFKRYMTKQNPSQVRLWDVLNPDVPRLLEIFQDYLAYMDREGISKRALSAASGMRQQHLDALTAKAEAGDAEAQFSLGSSFYAGTGESKNLSDAAKWFGKAAEQGHADAQAVLGYMLFHGEGIEADADGAERWSLAAAKQGKSDAQFLIGLIYAKRIAPLGETPEARSWAMKARKWVGKAAKAKFPKADALLARIEGYLNKTGEAANARDQILQLAKAGNADAQLRVATWYQSGNGVRRDYATAAKWFQLAAKQGQPDACFNLGVMRLQGVGLPKSPVRAVQWLEKAAAGNHPKAQTMLGVLVRAGQGVAKNSKRAVALFRAAAEQGYSVGQRNLASHFETGSGVAPDPVEAYKWYSLAAQNGDEKAAKARAVVAGRLSPQQKADAEIWIKAR